MKRAKMILAAIAVFAVVGGVYASKANRAGDVVFTPNPSNPAICNVPLQLATFVNRNLGTISTNTSATFPAGPCALKTIYVGI